MGANASHPYASTVFDDGTFELLPIPESPPIAGPHSVLLGELTSWNQPGRPLRRLIPRRLWDKPAHLDPEFVTMTYGDNCESSPRAAALKRVAPRDLIFFIARLRRADGTRSAFGFYLVGFLDVSEVLRSVRSRLTPATLQRFGANAHVRRGLNGPRHWDGFWVFGGSTRSRRFRRAVPVDRDFAVSVLRASSGLPWAWPAARTELQTIGSYTRTCRCIIDPASSDAVRRTEALRRHIEYFNPDAFQPGEE